MAILHAGPINYDVVSIVKLSHVRMARLMLADITATCPVRNITAANAEQLRGLLLKETVLRYNCGLLETELTLEDCNGQS